MDGLRKFIAVDNYEAVKVGGLQQNANYLKAVKPKFTAHLHRHHQSGGRSVGASAIRRRVACSLPGYFQGN